MIKKILFLVVLVVVALFATESFAQMINYDRLNKRRGTTPPTPPKTGTLQAQSSQATLPTWLVTPPKVTSKIEESYDINRDKKLQSSEIKMFLRDVVDEINDKGGYTVNSDLLKQFDKNKDGIVSRLELPELQKLVR